MQHTTKKRKLSALKRFAEAHDISERQARHFVACGAPHVRIGRSIYFVECEGDPADIWGWINQHAVIPSAQGGGEASQ